MLFPKTFVGINLEIVHIGQCGKECVQYHRDQMAELNQGYYDNIAASGIAINTLTDEQREAFKDASASVYDEYRDKIGGDLLDAVVAACAK